MDANVTHEHEDGVFHTHEQAHEQTHGQAHEQPHEHNHTKTKTVINRLSRAAGHLEAVKRMVEDGRDCSEVLIQLAAVRAALTSTAKIILKDHIDHCVIDAAESGDLETISKLNDAIDMLMK